MDQRHAELADEVDALGSAGEHRLRAEVDRDVYPIAWPFSHIGGSSMLTVSLVAGTRLVLFDVFDPATTPERMAVAVSGEAPSDPPEQAVRESSRAVAETARR